MKVVHDDMILVTFDRKDKLLCLELTEKKDWLCGVFLTADHTEQLIEVLQDKLKKFSGRAGREG